MEFDLLQARNLRDARLAASCHYCFVEFDLLSCDLDGFRVDELGATQVHINSKLLKSFSRVVVRDLRANISHPLHDCREVDFDGICLNFDPKLSGRLDSLGNLACFEEGFRWNTAIVQTITTKECSLNYANFGPETGRSHRSDQATRPTANHNQVILALI